MTGQVIPLPVRPAPDREPLLTKKMLAAHLQVSTRWIELRQREGLPSKLLAGRRRYRLSDVMAWLRERE